MHLILATRGVKQWIDEFITELQGIYLPWHAKIKGQDKTDWCVQVGVQPIQLWSITFPEEHKDLILTTILGGEGTNKGKCNTPRLRKYFDIIRKFIGLEPIPDYSTAKFLPIQKEHMEVIGIGIKKDRKMVGEGFDYEGL